MIDIEKIAVTQPILCTAAAIDEFRGEFGTLKNFDE